MKTSCAEPVQTAMSALLDSGYSASEIAVAQLRLFSVYATPEMPRKRQSRL